MKHSTQNILGMDFDKVYYGQDLKKYQVSPEDNKIFCINNKIYLAKNNLIT
jgi:hypothetical protein